MYGYIQSWAWNVSEHLDNNKKVIAKWHLYRYGCRYKCAPHQYRFSYRKNESTSTVSDIFILLELDLC